jgi:hypothetical protein
MGFIIAVVICAITALFADRKGFNPAYWFLAAGCIGWVVLALLPSANAQSLGAEEKVRRKRLGDRVGFYISAVAFVFILINIGSTIAMRTI